MPVELPIELPPDLVASATAIDADLPWLHASVLEAIEARAKSALESNDKRAITSARAMLERVDGHGELLAQLAEDGRCAEASRFLPGSSVDQGILHLAEQDEQRLFRLELLDNRLGDALERAKFALPKKLNAARALAFAEKVLTKHPNVAEASALPNEPEWRALLSFLPSGTIHERFVRARFQWIGDDPFPREEVERLSLEGSRKATECLYYRAFKGPEAIRRTIVIRLAEQGNASPALNLGESLRGRADTWTEASEWLLRAARSTVDDARFASTELDRCDRDKAAATALGMHAIGRAPLDKAVVEELVGKLSGRAHRDLDSVARAFGLHDLDGLLSRAQSA